jgi:hypothetical protein
MDNLEGCQIPCLPNIAEGNAEFGPQPIVNRLKRMLARPWNFHVKKFLKRSLTQVMRWYSSFSSTKATLPVVKVVADDTVFHPGDWVRVRSREEIQATLNAFKELRGCAFLADMWQYCGTTHRVLKSMQRFLDERDYKVKKTRGVILLEGVLCQGTPVFGPCDRCCHLFWREEWLEKVEGSLGNDPPACM